MVVSMTPSQDMEGPRVTVVVAMFERREKTVACARSLVAQDIDRAEIVFVDDGSEDGTPDAVEAVGRASRLPVTVLRNERNLGANASRNRGVAAAKAPLVAFIDSDCVAAPDWLRSLVEPFERDPSIGAASGLVEDGCVGNVWERVFAGTHRLARRGPSGRITSCNLCIRRTLMSPGAWDETRPTRTDGGRPDTAISARCDEEGLNLAIRAAGWSVVAEPSAVVEHFHPYTRRSLFRQAFFGGCSVAEIVHRYRLGPRKDLGPILVTWILLAIAIALGPFLGWWTLLAPAATGSLAAAAIAYNEVRNKGRAIGDLVLTAPAILLYYQIRLAGYVLRTIQLGLGIRPVARVSPAAMAASLPRPPGASPS